MRKWVWLAAVSAMMCLLYADTALARGRGCGGCGGGGGRGRHHGGCGGGGCGSASGCATCGGGGGGYYATGTCAGGACGVAYASTDLGSTGAIAQLLENKPATLVVTLPAEATLIVEDQPTSSTSSERVFQTPALELGKEYVYTLKA